jgi:glycosyltransferase involved in cell wall biosynthesis
MAGPPLHLVSVQTTNEKGGAEYSNVDLLKGLAERGARVLLLTNYPELADGSGVPVRPVDLGPKLSRRSALRVALGFMPWFLRLLQELRRARAAGGPVDVLLVHYKKEQLMAALVPRRLARTVVWAEWGPVPFEFRRGLPRLLYALAARRAARIAAISEGTRESIESVRVPGDKIEVIPNAIDVDRIRFDQGARERYRAEWGARNGTFVMGSIARLHPKKRNDVLIEALGDLEGDVLLVIAGEGEDELRLRELARADSPRVRLLPTPRGYAGELLSAFDVALFAPAPTEGAPRSIAMAQLAGRPVIATAPEGAADMLVAGTGTVISPPNDARALARTIEGYRDDPERRRAEGERARAHAELRYDRTRVEDAFDRLIRDAASS